MTVCVLFGAVSHFRCLVFIRFLQTVERCLTVLLTSKRTTTEA